MSGEHLWSDWMSRPELLGSGGDHEEVADAGKVGSQTISFRRERQGAANTVKIRVVCEDCNNVWMSGLEAAVQPILIPLMTDGLVTLNAASKTTLAEWIVLKMLVVEHISVPAVPADPIFRQHERTAFMQSRTIPEGIRILICRQKGEKWRTSFFRYGTTLDVSDTPDPPEPEPGTPKNVQTCTWGIGNILIYFFATTNPRVYKSVDVIHEGPLRRLWPLSGKNILWPPSEFVSDPFADALCEDVERFLHGEAIIKPRAK